MPHNFAKMRNFFSKNYLIKAVTSNDWFFETIMVMVLIVVYFYYGSGAYIFCDTLSTDFWFQTPLSYYMLEIVEFHNFIFLYISFIAIVVSWVLYQSLDFFRSYYFCLIGGKFNHATVMEIIWTIVPALVLVSIAVPSFTMLYSNVLEDATISSDYTFYLNIKAVGHQWYWSYEYTTISELVEMGDSILKEGVSKTEDITSVSMDSIFEKSLNFDSFVVSESDLTTGSYRLLEVDQYLVLPQYSYIKFLISSNDVLHSWAVPSIGIKTDACPGRLSVAWIDTLSEGQMYGQCSEICGINHGFMPIVVKISNEFSNWCSLKVGDNLESVYNLFSQRTLEDSRSLSHSSPSIIPRTHIIYNLFTNEPIYLTRVVPVNFNYTKINTVVNPVSYINVNDIAGKNIPEPKTNILYNMLFSDEYMMKTPTDFVGTFLVFFVVFFYVVVYATIIFNFVMFCLGWPYWLRLKWWFDV